ncbi:MAG: SCO family protein [Pseudomonadales bacterium]
MSPAVVHFGLSVLLSAIAAFSAAQVRADADQSDRHRHPRPVVLAPGYARLEFQPPMAGKYALPALGYAADGAVIDVAGSPRRVHDFLGDKIVVLSFIYTTCSDVNGCPLATHVLRGVQDHVVASDDLRDQVRLVSFSFDPAHDTPAVLRDYSRHFKRPDFDWQFLTSRDEQTLEPVLRDYDQWIIKDYDAEGKFLGTMSHLLRVYLIDRQRRIRNIYSVSYLHADSVGNDIRTLLIEQGRENRVDKTARTLLEPALVPGR